MINLDNGWVVSVEKAKEYAEALDSLARLCGQEAEKHSIEEGAAYAYNKLTNYGEYDQEYDQKVIN